VKRFVLASQSPIRAKMLRQAGLVVEVRPAGLDERELERGLPGSTDPGAVALYLAEEKAKIVSRSHPEAIVIGADQTLALDGQRFSKAASLKAARTTLMRLRGRSHHLHSAFAIAMEGEVRHSGVATASLKMRAFSARALDDYLAQAGAAVLSSVGCYQMEGLGISLFEAMDGDYFTILGLPLLPLLASLRDLGLARD